VSFASAPVCWLTLALGACPTQTIVFSDTGLDMPTDADADGYYTPQDCDDDDPTVHPGADEICDEQDNDCDGREDGQDPTLVDGETWYQDADGDEYGNTDVSLVRCGIEDGYVHASGDCDDGDPDVNPGVNERCNEVDDNCNGLIDGQDPSLEDGVTWCWDGDEDGFGDPTFSDYRCSQPVGWVADCSDCDDSDPEVWECDDTGSGLPLPGSNPPASRGEWR